MKKRKTREEVIQYLVKTDPNFRRLYERVLETNGGILPTPEDTRRLVEARIAQGRASS